MKYRSSYTKDDMLEAIRLVQVEGYCIAAAANKINERKLNKIPRITLSDNLKREGAVMPPLGRKQVPTGPVCL
jgi:hypothetical protein